MSTRRWTEEHGADGLRRKFDVYKHANGQHRHQYGGKPTRSEYPAATRIGADGEFAMVLRPETDVAAANALSFYANNVEHRAPQLAADIRVQLDRIREENRHG